MMVLLLCDCAAAGSWQKRIGTNACMCETANPLVMVSTVRWITASDGEQCTL